MSPRVKVPFLVLMALFLHTTLLGSIHVRHVRPDGMLLLVVLSALVGGQQAGTVVGFVAGLLADLTLQTPFGLSALVLTLTGFSVGTVRTALVRAAWWLAPLIAFVASAAAVAGFAILGALVGQAQLLRPGPVHLLVVATLVGAMNAVLTLGVHPAVRWAFAPAVPERSYAR